MSIYKLKAKFQDLLRPLVQKLYDLGVTANQVTLFACILSMAIGLHIYYWGSKGELWWFATLAPWMLIRMGLNAIDGMLAREFGQKSKLGAYLNELTDLIADAFLYLSFFAVVGLCPALLMAFIWLAALSEMTGVVGVMIGGGRRYDGPMGKSDRAFLVGLSGLLYGLGLAGGETLAWFFGVGCLMLLVTVCNRVREGLREARGDG